MLDVLDVLDVLELLMVVELLSGVGTIGSEVLLDELTVTGASELLEVRSELCTELLVEELLTVLELCGEEDTVLVLTLITVLALPEVSDVFLQPVKLAHIIISDSAAAKNLDFLFIVTTQLPFKIAPPCLISSSMTAPAYAAP